MLIFAKTNEVLKHKIYIVFFLSFFCSATLLAQEKETNPVFVGAAIQFYPAGIITTVHADIMLNNNNSIYTRIGGNYANRQDFSDFNDNEKGGGFGGSVGYRRHFPLKKGKLIAGFNTDVWNLWIRWKNDINTTFQTRGTTYTLVLQPWAEGGYFYAFKSSLLQIGLTAGFGKEFNVITDGKKVEADWIGSLKLHVQVPLQRKK